MFARTTCLSVVSFLTVLGLSLQAWSSELSDKYLLGKWAIDATDCSDSSSEFVIFRDSGALENVRGGKLEAAGFWKLEDDIMKIHIVASPPAAPWTECSRWVKTRRVPARAISVELQSEYLGGVFARLGED